MFVMEILVRSDRGRQQDCQDCAIIYPNTRIGLDGVGGYYGNRPKKVLARETTDRAKSNENYEFKQVG